MEKRQVRGIAALIAASGLACSTVSAQSVADWLLPVTGLWSDANNWSGGDVPDSFDEIARIAPDVLGRGATQQAVLVDGSFEAEELIGTGILGVVIQNDSSLIIGSLIEGIGDEPLVVVVGDDSLVGGGAMLELVGTGDPRTGRTNLNSVTIELSNADAELVSGEETRIAADSIITGSGRIIGDFRNSGLIVARNDDVLTITDASINGSGLLAAEFGSVLRIEQSDIVAGVIEPFSADVELTNVDLRFTEIRGVNGLTAVEGESTFTDVVIDSSADLLITDRVFYTATDGVFLNEGDILIDRPGRIDFDDTPDNAVLIEGGRVTLEGGRMSAQANDEIYMFPGATIGGSGFVVGDVVNLGNLDAREFDAEFPRSTLSVGGDFTQLSLGRLSVGVAQRLLPDLGPAETQSLVVDGDAVLGGELEVDYLVLDAQLVAGVPFTVLLVRGSDSAVIGEFDRVSIVGATSGLSPIPQIDYTAQRVDITLFCVADVNRDGAVAPNDFAAWIGAFNANDPLADQNGDGVLAPNDLNAWVSNFQAGCGQ